MPATLEDSVTEAEEIVYSRYREITQAEAVPLPPIDVSRRINLGSHRLAIVLCAFVIGAVSVGAMPYVSTDEPSTEPRSASLATDQSPLVASLEAVERIDVSSRMQAAEIAPGVTLAIVTSETTTQAILRLDASTAPTRYEFTEGMPPGEPVLLESGGIELLGESGEIIGQIDPPWAFAADGSSVPTRYEVTDNSIVQIIDHSESMLYPIVADPSYSCGWVTCTTKFNRFWTANIASGGVLVGAACSAVAYFTAGIGGVVCAAIGASIVYTASYAQNRGRCLRVRTARYGVPGYLPGTYSGGYCR